MSANRVALIEAVKKGRAAKPETVKLKLAERPTGDRLRQLTELASALFQEAQTLARDKAFADESAKLQTLDLESGIDFYAEVKKFETRLILLALEQTGGNQANAAVLLNLKPTTLNSKIKLYQIPT